MVPAFGGVCSGTDKPCSRLCAHAKPTVSQYHADWNSVYDFSHALRRCSPQAQWRISEWSAALVEGQSQRGPSSLDHAYSKSTPSEVDARQSNHDWDRLGMSCNNWEGTS
eukprot:5472710-Amphidinium_carterae.1